MLCCFELNFEFLLNETTKVYHVCMSNSILQIRPHNSLKIVYYWLFMMSVIAILPPQVWYEVGIFFRNPKPQPLKCNEGYSYCLALTIMG